MGKTSNNVANQKVSDKIVIYTWYQKFAVYNLIATLGLLRAYSCVVLCNMITANGDNC